MGFFDFLRYSGTRGAILRQGEEQARKFGASCDYVSREFIRRNNLNAIPAPVWDACVSKGTCPSGLTPAVRDLLSAHAVHGVAREYAPLMVACALHHPGPTFKRAAAISLVKLMAPSQESDAAFSIAAASVLAPLVFLESSSKSAREFRAWLMDLTQAHLPSDHDYIWMKLAEVAQEMNLE